MLYRLSEREPRLDESAYVVPSATIIGDVHIAREVSVWFGAVVRGDNERISLGPRCNVQDNSVLHADPGYPLELQEDVSVGHLAMLHGCRIGAGAMVGIGAVILNGAMIGGGCLIAAGALIPEGRLIPDHSIVRGTPGRVVAQVTDRHRAIMRRTVQSYLARARHYLDHLARVAPTGEDRAPECRA